MRSALGTSAAHCLLLLLPLVWCWPAISTIWSISRQHQLGCCPSFALYAHSAPSSSSSSMVRKPKEGEFEQVSIITVGDLAPAIPEALLRGGQQATTFPLSLPLYLHCAHGDAFPSITTARKAVRRQEMRVNGAWALSGATVSPGDCVQQMKRVLASDAASAAARHRRHAEPLRVVYEDDYIGVVVKPPGEALAMAMFTSSAPGGSTLTGCTTHVQVLMRQHLRLSTMTSLGAEKYRNTIACFLRC